MSNKSHENMSLGEVKRANPDELLPGFRFHPTDEELVGYYLRRKVMQKSLAVEVITQLDIYKFDPWDLPKMALVEGEKDWYFFCPRDRKYRNSARPNRVTGAGFWKATGTDRHIYASGGSKTIGLKKSLVFYKGRAPKALKTDWMMHEFRLPPNLDSPTSFHVPSADDPIPKDAWAICRIFKKSTLAQQRSASMITQQRHEQSSEGGLTVRTEDLDESETGFEPIQSEKKYFCNPNVDLDNDTSETRSETTSEDGSLSLQREDLHDKAIQFTNEESTANWPHLGLPSPESIDSSRLSENLWSTASLGMANDLFAHDFALRGDILDSVDSIPSVQPSSAIGIHSQYINVDARNLEMLEFEDFTMECTLDSGPKLGSAIYQYVEPFNRRKLSLQIPAYYCAM